MADSTVTVVGNVTREPELRYLPSGQAQATFGVAVNRRYQIQGEWKEQTSFFDVVVWREHAENVASSLAKGTRVVVYGRLEQRSWETQDGERRSKIEIVADEVAPSLRWATAEVTKNQRGDNAGGYSGSNRQSQPRASVPADDVAHDPFGSDEDPF